MNTNTGAVFELPAETAARQAKLDALEAEYNTAFVELSEAAVKEYPTDEERLAAYKRGALAKGPRPTPPTTDAKSKARRAQREARRVTRNTRNGQH